MDKDIETLNETEEHLPHEILITSTSVVKDWYTVTFVIISIFAVAGILGSLLTVVAFVKCSTLRKPTYFLVCNLAVNDLLTGPLLFIMTFHQYIKEGILSMAKNKYSYLITFWACNLCLYSSLGSVALISLERLLAVVVPLKHKYWVSRQNVLVGILTAWMLILLLTTPPLLGWNTWQPGIHCKAYLIYDNVYFSAAFIIVPIVTTIIVVICNFVIAYKATRRSKVLPVMITIKSASGPDTSSSSHQGANNGKNMKITKRQYRITKMLLIVVGIFCISWIPYIVKINLLKVYTESKTSPPEYIFIIFDVSKMLMVAGIMLNPLIYAGQNNDFRTAYKKILGCK